MNRLVTTFCACMAFVMMCGAARGAAALGEPQDVTFTAICDRTEQKYILMLPDGFDAQKPHDILIALHGHGSDRWQFATKVFDEARAARDTAAGHDMIYVSPDYRAATSWMGPKAEADVVQIIADLKKQYKVGKVYICGASMGGASCLTFAALHPETIAGVAAMNGVANHLEYELFQDAISESYGGSKKQNPAEYKRRSAEYWPERLAKMPVAMACGGKDELTPPASFLRLAEVLKKINDNVLLINREDWGHSTQYDDSMALLEFIIEKSEAQPAEKTSE